MKGCLKIHVKQASESSEIKAIILKEMKIFTWEVHLCLPGKKCTLQV